MGIVSQKSLIFILGENKINFNKSYTFRSSGKTSKTLLLYLLVYIFSLFFGLIILNGLVDYFGIEILIANFLIIFVTTTTNFFGTKILVFRNKKW